MAEQLVNRYSGGRTLHHTSCSCATPGSPSSATRTSAPPLMAIGGHKGLVARSGTSKLSQDAVAALMAANGSDRRRG